MRWQLILAALLLPLAATAASPDTAYNRGVEAYRVKDFARARIEWAAAVKENETSAFNNLGYLLFYGLGGEKDGKGGVALWRTAAARGLAESQLHLGHAYEAGDGVPKSLLQAYVWMACAMRNAEAAKDDVDEAAIAGNARKALAKVSAQLRPGQIESAETFTSKCVAKPPPK